MRAQRPQAYAHSCTFMLNIVSVGMAKLLKCLLLKYSVFTTVAYTGL